VLSHRPVFEGETKERDVDEDEQVAERDVPQGPLRLASEGIWSRLKQRWWNPADRRLFTSKTLGWGYDINLARLFRRKPKREI
jgi:hypothetical protein